MKVYNTFIYTHAYISSIVNKFKIDENNMKNISLPMPPLATAAYYLFVYKNLNMGHRAKKEPPKEFSFICVTIKLEFVVKFCTVRFWSRFIFVFSCIKFFSIECSKCRKTYMFCYSIVNSCEETFMFLAN